MLEYRETEAALGAIVFGPTCDTLEGMQWTAAKLRQAAALLEYRFAIERRSGAHQLPADGESVQERNQRLADDGQQGQQLAPAKRKRNRGRPAKATNGTTEPTPPTEPLFVEIPSGL
jgi:hypothetical protein